MQENEGRIEMSLLLGLRHDCYRDIEKLRGRPLIVYASKFIQHLGGGIPNSIDLADLDGFSDLAQSINHSDSIDVILHSPGGSPDATERLVFMLRSKFKEVHFLIPHSAYSAATMLALSGNSITLHPNATLGPIDPQINGVPAGSIKRGFANIKEKIKSEGPSALPAYLPLIEKYSLHLLELCDDSEKLSVQLVCDWIKKYMANGGLSDDRISEIGGYFSDYDGHKLHSRPLVFDKIKDFGLPITQSDHHLSNLLWEAYVLIEGFFQITPFYKLYENAHGVSWGKSHSPNRMVAAQGSRNEIN